MIKSFKGKVLASFLFAVFIIGASLIIPEHLDFSDNDTDLQVAKVLAVLGEKTSSHYPRLKDFTVSASRGESLIKEGIATKPGGGKTKIQSKHFVCTSCHNLERGTCKKRLT